MDAVEGLISFIGSRNFGEAGINLLSRALPMQWWTAYEIFGNSVPRLLIAGNQAGVADCTSLAWSAYVAKIHTEDRSFDSIDDVCENGHPIIAYQDARDFTALHRSCIYDRYRLSGRLSVVQRQKNGRLLAINFYRDLDQAKFADKDLTEFMSAASMLMACVRRHKDLIQPESNLISSAQPFLAALGKREREVCVRLLRGWTQEGVAADLLISPTTVRTYQERAFKRLGIKTRHQLFAKAISSQVRNC